MKLNSTIKIDKKILLIIGFFLFLILIVGAITNDDSVDNSINTEITKKVVVKLSPTPISQAEVKTEVSPVSEFESIADEVNYDEEIDEVYFSIGDDVELNLSLFNFKATLNPKGEGVIVYYPQTSFSGVERKLLWLVINGDAYPLNGASYNVTPDLLWLRDAPKGDQVESGLNIYSVDKEILAILD